MEIEIEEQADTLMNIVKPFSIDDRASLFKKVKEEYCTECGSHIPEIECYCLHGGQEAYEAEYGPDDPDAEDKRDPLTKSKNSTVAKEIEGKERCGNCKWCEPGTSLNHEGEDGWIPYGYCHFNAPSARVVKDDNYQDWEGNNLSVFPMVSRMGDWCSRFYPGVGK